MRVTPRTNEELQTMNLLTEGQYAYEVLSAKERLSKSGAEMIELQLRIYDNQDRAHLIYDYLLDSMMHKLFHFVESHELGQKYLEGNLSSEDCIGKKGYASVIIRQDKTGQYGPRNSVKDYTRKLNTSAATEDFVDDTIPF